MEHNEELEHRGWKIICKCSNGTKRTRYFMWSPNGVNMGAKDTLDVAKRHIDSYENRRTKPC